MKIVDCSRDMSGAIGDAVAAVEGGELVVLPTDTVYGVGADAFSPAAVDKLLSAKGRGRDKPSPVLVACAADAERLTTGVPAVARALITHPKLVLADEPTGALDSKASGQLLGLLDGINAGGQTILIVTHSVGAASHAGRVLFIKDGTVFHELRRGTDNNDQMYRRISATLTALAGGGEGNV